MLVRPASVAVVLVCALLGATACSGEEPAAAPPPVTPASTPTSSAPSEGTIAVMMPGPSRRTLGFDSSAFTSAVADNCADCAVDYYDAAGDAGLQVVQFTTAIDAGARVVLIHAVEPVAVAPLIEAAQEGGVKVVGYETLLEGLDAYIALDQGEVGREQARSLLDADGGQGSMLMLNGAPTDPGALQVKEGAHRVIDRSGAAVVGEFDALPERPGATATWLETMLVFYPPAVLSGVYAADDTLAGSTLDALRAAGAAEAVPPITGAGATLAGVRRIVDGTQLMTTYRPVEPAAQTAAQVTVAALRGTNPGPAGSDALGVPTYLLDPVVVTRRNVEETVVADGYWSVESICTRALRTACTRAGLR
ncbi:MAG: substrate-binding domain-containing protein [Nocardioides sp.]